LGLKIGEGVDHASLRANAEYFQFNSVFINKKKLFFLKKKTETGSNRPVSVMFSFLGQKPVQIGLARFFLVFFGLGSVRFFQF
jgi:hypothetical protein